MRTEQQIKRKYNELAAQKRRLETIAEEAGETDASIRLQLERLEDSMLLLEWVLNEPTGKYHG